MQYIANGKLYDGVMTRNVYVDTTGVYFIFPDDTPNAMTWGGPGGGLDTVTIGPDPQGFSYRQTYTYTGAVVTSVSGWVKL